MKINVNQAITDLEDQPISQEGKVLTLRDVIQGALLNQLRRDEADMTAEKKVKAFNLALAVKSEEVDLQAEDISFIKTRIGLGYSALVVGRAFNLLDPKET